MNCNMMNDIRQRNKIVHVKQPTQIFSRAIIPEKIISSTSSNDNNSERVTAELAKCYDEIDQIYDYIRGLAPLPIQLRKIKSIDFDQLEKDKKFREQQEELARKQQKNLFITAPTTSKLAANYLMPKQSLPSRPIKVRQRDANNLNEQQILKGPQEELNFRHFASKSRQVQEPTIKVTTTKENFICRPLIKRVESLKLATYSINDNIDKLMPIDKNVDDKSDDNKNDNDNDNDDDNEDDDDDDDDDDGDDNDVDDDKSKQQVMTSTGSDLKARQPAYFIANLKQQNRCLNSTSDLHSFSTEQDDKSLTSSCDHLPLCGSKKGQDERKDLKNLDNLTRHFEHPTVKVKKIPFLNNDTNNIANSFPLPQTPMQTMMRATFHNKKNHLQAPHSSYSTHRNGRFFTNPARQHSSLMLSASKQENFPKTHQVTGSTNTTNSTSSYEAAIKNSRLEPSAETRARKFMSNQFRSEQQQQLQLQQLTTAKQTKPRASSLSSGKKVLSSVLSSSGRDHSVGKSNHQSDSGGSHYLANQSAGFLIKVPKLSKQSHLLNRPLPKPPTTMTTTTGSSGTIRLIYHHHHHHHPQHHHHYQQQQQQQKQQLVKLIKPSDVSNYAVLTTTYSKNKTPASLSSSSSNKQRAKAIDDDDHNYMEIKPPISTIPNKHNNLVSTNLDDSTTTTPQTTTRAKTRSKNGMLSVGLSSSSSSSTSSSLLSTASSTCSSSDRERNIKLGKKQNEKRMEEGSKDNLTLLANVPKVRSHHHHHSNHHSPTVTTCTSSGISSRLTSATHLQGSLSNGGSFNRRSLHNNNNNNAANNTKEQKQQKLLLAVDSFALMDDSSVDEEDGDYEAVCHNFVIDNTENKRENEAILRAQDQVQEQEQEQKRKRGENLAHNRRQKEVDKNRLSNSLISNQSAIEKAKRSARKHSAPPVITTASGKKRQQEKTEEKQVIKSKKDVLIDSASKAMMRMMMIQPKNKSSKQDYKGRELAMQQYNILSSNLKLFDEKFSSKIIDQQLASSNDSLLESLKFSGTLNRR